MRTAVTLDADVAALLQRLMKERDLTFKEAVNSAIRAALSGHSRDDDFQTPTFRMGFNPTIPWDKSLRLAGKLEEDELIRRLATRK